ncbi:MAG: protein kinase family protein [Eubacterium sp.]|nr:protein kinase family protein [Eubacterium sp.]
MLREAKLSEYLDHKNVVRTYQTGSSNGTLFILMDLCEGGSADDLMKLHGGTLPLPLATYIMLQVLRDDLIRALPKEVKEYCEVTT